MEGRACSFYEPGGPMKCSEYIVLCSNTTWPVATGHVTCSVPGSL